ncbi:hypothetical protein LOTGIDRAFT_234797 [Lottia gigantea]|uniref:RING-type domain-containing protein n=1 Tax=Lottia gigantea TaxID=225164 RepID=V4A457_LOTGI|nr:hypothetical protein LOTGIDRAFT_234797 [Lottia gigantea]ESO88031.1 hypothetical protein LOTGIDRAFT_234797 [Lottia gigantea]
MTEKKIPLTITSSYARHWGEWEGVRELVQNWHDGVHSTLASLESIPIGKNIVQFKGHVSGYSAEFDAFIEDEKKGNQILLGNLNYDGLTSKLKLTNYKTCLQKKILLLGYSAKAEKKEIIGQFGEGLKIGTLALVRKGYMVTMETARDQWSFRLLENEEFGEKVLTVIISERDVDVENDDIEKLQQIEDEITTAVVSGLDSELWKKFLPRFLFLKPPTDVVKTDLGRLLLDENLSGQLYNKGIWVSDLSHESLAAGVDFTNLQIDRDRNAVPKPSEIDHQVSCMWIKAIQKDSRLIPRYFHLLQDDKYRDVRHAEDYSDKDTAMLLANHFLKNFGESATPVLNNTEAETIRAAVNDLQKDVVLCNKTMINILMKSGLFSELLGTTHTEEKQIIPFTSLDTKTKDVLRKAFKLISIADKSITLLDVDVVGTTQDKTRLCSYQDGRVELPSWFLDESQIHDYIDYCSSSDSHNCLCREMVVCYGILSVIPSYLTTPPSILYLILCLCREMVVCYGILLNQEKEIIKNDNIESFMTRSDFIEREASLVQRIEVLEKELKKEQTSTSKMVLDMKNRLKKTENELLQREISLVNDEMKIKDGYEQQLKNISKQAEESIKQLQRNLKAIEDEKLDLERKLHHKTSQIRRLQDEANKFYELITKSILRLSEEGRRTGDVINQEKWKVIGDLCDMLIEDLQTEKILCCMCKIERKTYLLQPCGHYNYCKTCAITLIEKRNNCPVCNSNIEDIKQVFE